MTQITEIVTHDGPFHADDVCAAVILSEVFPNARIIRTRDRAVTVTAPQRICFDVGGIYSPEYRMFDHHQPDAPRRKDGKTYSSFGLIWAQYGKDFLRSLGCLEGDIADLHKLLDTQFVRPIDLLDNGELKREAHQEVSGITLPALVGALRPVWPCKASSMDRGFRNAMGMVDSLLRAQVGHLEAKLVSDRSVIRAIEENWGSAIIELPNSADFREVVEMLGADELLFVIAPGSSGGWGVTAVSKEVGSFENRMDMPAEWGGLMNEAAAAASGIDGLVFVHRNLFYAATTTREAAYAFATASLQIGRERLMAPAEDGTSPEMA